MKINNIIGKTFEGPPVVAGYLIIFSGVGIFLMSGVSVSGYSVAVVFIVAASFVSFTYSGVEIDTELRQVKNYYKLFGLFKTGKWISLDKYRGVTLIRMRKIYTTASQSNRINSVEKKDYRVFLVNQSKRPAFAIKKCKTIEQAQNSLDEFSIWLKFPVFSPKRSIA